MSSTTLLIAYCFPPSTEPGAQRPARFYKYLPSYGYQPLVLTSTPQDPQAPQERVHCVEAVIRPMFSPEGFIDRVLTRYVIAADPGELRWSRDAVAAAVELHRASSFTSVISTFPPLGTHLVALQLKRRLGIKWVADFRDPLGDNPYRTRPRICAAVDRWIEREVFRHADVLIANTDAVRESWQRRYPQYNPKFHLIWNGFDPAEPVQARPSPPRKCRVLGHFGPIYGDRHPGILIESLQRLILSGQLDPQAVQIVQQGPVDGTFERYAALRDELKRQGVWVENSFMVPREEARKLQYEVDSLLLLDTPGDRPSQVPSKLFEYTQVGRPILTCTTKGSPVERLLDESGIPNVKLYYDSPGTEIDANLSAFLKLPTDPVPMAGSFAEKYDGRRQTGQLARILKSLD